VPVIDADEVARQVVRPGEPALQAVVAAFGREMLQPDGALDRRRLAERVFADPAARRRLEAILHPAILREMGRQTESLRRLPDPPPVVIAVIPLLFEARCEGTVDGILVVSAGREEQIRRLMARDGLTREQALQRLQAQWPLEEKAARADWVIDSEAGPEAVEARVDALLSEWLAASAGCCRAQEGHRNGPSN
jgi:dephospho-CoA kinase